MRSVGFFCVLSVLVYLAAAASPIGTSCANPQVVSTFSRSYTSTTLRGRLWHPSNASACSYYTSPYTNGTYFKFTSSVDGYLNLSTCTDTHFDTVLESQSGCGRGQQCLKVNDDSCGVQSRLSLPLRAYSPVFVVLRPFSYYSTTDFSYVLKAAFNPSVLPDSSSSSVVSPPHYPSSSSDDETCLKGHLITAYRDYSVTYGGYFPNNFTSAYPCSGSRQVVWYSFKPMVDGSLTVSTCGTSSAVDTVVGIASGTSCNSQTCLGYNDDTYYCTSTYSHSYSSLLTMNVRAGTLYNIEVYPYSSVSSWTYYYLSITFSVPASSSSTPPVESSSDAYCPSYFTYVSDPEDYYSTYNYLYQTNPEPNMCWRGYYANWYKFYTYYSGYYDVYVCADSAVRLTYVSNLCTDSASCQTYADSYYDYYYWCPAGYGAHISYYAVGYSAPYSTVAVTSSTYYASYSISSDASYFPTGYSSSSDFNIALFWAIFVPVCFGLAVCICCVGLLVCLRRRKAARNTQNAAYKQVRDVSVCSSVQTPAAPQAARAPAAAQSTQLVPLPAHLQQNLPPAPPGYQYMYMPYPYYPNFGGAAPTTSSIYPTVAPSATTPQGPAPSAPVATTIATQATPKGPETTAPVVSVTVNTTPAGPVASGSVTPQ